VCAYVCIAREGQEKRKGLFSQVWISRAEAGASQTRRSQPRVMRICSEQRQYSSGTSVRLASPGPALAIPRDRGRKAGANECGSMQVQQLETALCTGSLHPLDLFNGEDRVRIGPSAQHCLLQTKLPLTAQHCMKLALAKPAVAVVEISQNRFSNPPIAIRRPYRRSVRWTYAGLAVLETSQTRQLMALNPWALQDPAMLWSLARIATSCMWL